MFQRRSTSSTTSSAAPLAAGATSLYQRGRMPVRRKGGRRHSSLSSYLASVDDAKTLLILACTTMLLTAGVIGLAWRIYGFAYRGASPALPHGHRQGHHHHALAVGGDDEDDQEEDEYEVLPWNRIYRVPEAMDIMGDRSDEYARLRKEIDQKLPVDYSRSLQQVAALTEHFPDIGTFPQGAHHSDSVREPYDIYNCPEHPPQGYPFEWKLVDEVLAHWPVQEIDQVPAKIHQGLCIFDYLTDYAKAVRYRKAEVPFVVVNDPRVARTAERWNTPGYLSEMTGPNTMHRAQYNTNGHFLYSAPNQRQRLRQKRRQRRQQQDDGNEEEDEKYLDLQGRVAESQRDDTKPQALRMTYDNWLRKANETSHVDLEDEHYYFRLIGCGYMGTKGDCDQGSSEYLYDELPYFQPHNDNRNELYLGNPREQKGIHCRFGMKGVIAENHFDAGRNSIALLGGRRRYILSHPRQCSNLALFPHGHESARHSEVDYANPDTERFPEFAHDALANEVVLEAGQVLYLPVYWFHFIVSLEVNFQCNTRSGNTDHYDSFIRGCGFPIPRSN